VSCPQKDAATLSASLQYTELSQNKLTCDRVYILRASDETANTLIVSIKGSPFNISSGIDFGTGVATKGIVNDSSSSSSLFSGHSKNKATKRKKGSVSSAGATIGSGGCATGGAGDVVGCDEAVVPRWKYLEEWLKVLQYVNGLIYNTPLILILTGSVLIILYSN
jgi:hypothetical protein